MNWTEWIRTIWQHPFTAAAIATTACYCFYQLSTADAPSRKFYFILSRILLSIVLVFFVAKLIDRIAHPMVFDFSAFYLYGKAAVLGYDVYSPEQLGKVFSGLTDLPPLDYREFTEEIVQTGAMYPPPSMLLYAPFGAMTYPVSEKAWMAFTCLFIPLCIHQIIRIWFPEQGSKAWILVATLVLLLGASRDTVQFLQTNFITLYLLLLMKRYEHRPIAGIFLALGFQVKPYMAFFGLVFLFRKQWWALLYTAATGLAYGLITLGIWGKGIFLSYLFDNPSKRLPAWVFQEPINQSLHAVMLRWNLITLESPFMHTLLVSCILLLTLFILYWLNRKNLTDWHWPVVLLVALLIYPGTLNYYGVMLLFVFFMLLKEGKLTAIKAQVISLVVGAAFLACKLSLFLCCFLLLASLFPWLMKKQKRDEPIFRI